MSLRRRLLLLTSVVIVAVLAGTAGALALSSRRDTASAWAARMRSATVAAGKLEIAMLDQETGQRGYLLTGDPDFLVPYEDGASEFTEVEADLHRLVDGTAYRPLLDRAIQLATRWRSEGAQPEIVVRDSGGITAAGQTLELGTSKQLFDQYRTAQDELMSTLENAGTSARADVTRLSSRIMLTLEVVLLVNALLFVVAVVAVRQWILRPIAEVAGAARLVHHGALDHRISADGPPEIAGLARDIEGMRRTLRRYLDDSERSRRALEQNAALVLAMTASTATSLELPCGWSAAGEIHSAEGLVAGDTFDVISIGPDDIAAVVVDIAGHGAIEGLLALRCREQLRAALAAGADPAEALTIVAAQLGRPDDDIFLTAFAAVIHLPTGRCRYANAGHPPPLVVAGTCVRMLDATGPLIGPIEAEWRTEEVDVRPGEHLFVYTDGLTEARRVDGRFFGEDRLRRLAAGADSTGAPDLLRRYFAGLVEFGGQDRRDDITLLVVARDFSAR